MIDNFCFQKPSRHCKDNHSDTTMINPLNKEFNAQSQHDARADS